MGKKVVVIAFVVCLDLAFVFIMRGDFQSEALSQMAESTTEPPVLIARRSEIPQPTVSEEIPETRFRQSPEILLRPRATAIKISKSIESRNRTNRKFDDVKNLHRPATRTFTVKQSPENFSDTVIWIEKPTFAQNVRADVHSPQKAIDAPKAKIVRKKRSSFARVFPILRKPYDWLKALAIRLK